MAEKRFKVALSFPGEHRAFIEEVATHLALEFGKPQILYDKYHKAEFAQPDLDIYLPELYKKDSELVVYFLCEDYANKEWCGLEWRVIREMIKQRKRDMLMQFKFDLHPVPGDLTIDGYIEINSTKEAMTTKEVAELIIERYKINAAKAEKLASIDGPTGISILQKLEKDIAELKDARQSPETEQQIANLTEEKETLRLQLLQKDEIIAQQEQTRQELETSLAATKGNEQLKQKALEAVEAKNYDAAEELLQEAAKDRMAQVAEDFYQLGNIKELKLEYAEALKYYELAAKIPPLNLNYLDKAAYLFHKYGLLDKAMEYYELSLKIDLDKGGENTFDVAFDYNNIGLIWDEKGIWNKAIENFQIALKIFHEILPNDSEDIATLYNNIGAAWRHLGNLEEANNYFQKALEIDLNLHGENDKNTALRYNNLGNLSQDNGNFDKAIEYYNKALNIYMKIFGQDHYHIAVCYNNIGSAWQDKGDIEQAIRFFESALKIDFKIWGQDNPKVAIRYNNLGSVLLKKGDLNKAIEYGQKSYNIFLKLYGADNPSTKIAKDNLNGYLALEN